MTTNTLIFETSKPISRMKVNELNNEIAEFGIKLFIADYLSEIAKLSDLLNQNLGALSANVEELTLKFENVSFTTDITQKLMAYRENVVSDLQKVKPEKIEKAVGTLLYKNLKKRIALNNVSTIAINEFKVTTVQTAEVNYQMITFKKAR